MSLILDENGSIARHIVMKFWKNEDKEIVLRTLFFMKHRIGFSKIKNTDQGIQPKREETESLE